MCYAEIYVLRNIATGHVYVGSSVRGGESRARTHVKSLSHGKHGNSYLQRAWNKYGRDNFVAETIEKCSTDERWTREQWWIEHYQASERNFGYNICYPVRSLMPSERMSKIAKKSWKNASPEAKAKRISGVIDVWKDPAHKKKMSAVMKASRQDPSFNAKMTAAMGDDYRKRRAVLTRKMWRKAGHREKCSVAIKAAFSDERKLTYAKRMKSYWQDPEYQRKKSNDSKKVWKDPKSRKRHARVMKKHFKDPTYRARHAARMKEWWAARKAQ